MKHYITFGLLASLLVLSMISIGLSLGQAHAAPYFSSGDHKIKFTVKFDSDCWNEIYARSTPKNNNHILLNKQIIPNNDTPDSGPSETLYLKWNFAGSKMTQTKSTNEGKIRTYVTLELANGMTGETVTKYVAYDPTRTTTDFGTFYMHTDKSLCQ